jgi:fragile X mental retardation protein
MDDLSVEVLFNENIYYKARVVDVLAEELLVELESSSKPALTVPFHCARLPPRPSATTPELKEGDDVEVCQHIDSADAFAWVPMRVRMVKGDFVVVDIPDSKPPITDIVQIDNVRLPNKSPCVSATVFHRLSIDVPAELHPICRDEANHREFIQRCGASRVQFSAESSALIVLCRDEAIRKKASLLGDVHVRSLRQKMTLLQLTEESARKLESSKHPPAESPHHAEFSVPRDLMGLAIGTQGSNIQRARQLPGIHSVDLNEDTATFCISGESEAAISAARELLEYTERRLLLPRDMISRIIGRNGHNIQSIVDRAGVVQVKIEGDNETSTAREEGVVPFIFVGTVESIENAKVLLDYHIAHLKEVDKLTRQKQQLDAELHRLSQQATAATYAHSTTSTSTTPYVIEATVAEVPAAEAKVATDIWQLLMASRMMSSMAQQVDRMVPPTVPLIHRRTGQQRLLLRLWFRLLCLLKPHWN